MATGDGLALNVDEANNVQDLSLALEVAPVFRVDGGRARVIIEEVVSAVRAWRAQARAVGLSRTAQETMMRAFRVAEAG